MIEADRNRDRKEVPMTNEEAVKILFDYTWESCGYCHQGGEEIEIAIEMAATALDKQIPKKPIEAKNIYPPEQFECPCCGGCVGRHKTLHKINELLGEVLRDCKVEYPYCPECGQKIDWSDFE